MAAPVKAWRKEHLNRVNGEKFGSWAYTDNGGILYIRADLLERLVEAAEDSDTEWNHALAEVKEALTRTHSGDFDIRGVDRKGCPFSVGFRGKK